MDMTLTYRAKGRLLDGPSRPSQAAHRNITGDRSSIFAAVLKGEQTFVFEPALDLSQNTQKKKSSVIY